MKRENSKPRPTTGTHFSDFLICPQRAWLQYYGNSKDQAKDPAFLLALQREGLNYERAIYNKYFPKATKIPLIRDSKKRHKLTIESMNRGDPIILQAYFADCDRVGVVDFLERVRNNQSSTSGYTYRVGEIKSSVSLSTAHVLQAAWYNELVFNFHGSSLQEARFFIKNEREKTINLNLIKDDYNKIKGDLLNLRAASKPPGPFLIKACSSCRWRGVCMPELIDRKHFSLLPHMRRNYEKQFKNQNIFRWNDLNKKNTAGLEKFGLTNFEVEVILNAINCLDNNWPPLRYPLRKDLLEDLLVVVPEVPDLKSQRQSGKGIIPAALWFEGQNNKPEKIGVNLKNNKMLADMTPFASYKRLAFYGSTDLGIFRQLAKQNEYELEEYVDIFEIVENILHIPAPGTELGVLLGFITGRNYTLLDAKQRVEAIRKVIKWVAKAI